MQRLTAGWELNLGVAGETDASSRPDEDASTRGVCQQDSDISVDFVLANVEPPLPDCSPHPLGTTDVRLELLMKKLNGPGNPGTVIPLALKTLTHINSPSSFERTHCMSSV